MGARVAWGILFDKRGHEPTPEGKCINPRWLADEMARAPMTVEGYMQELADAGLLVASGDRQFVYVPLGHNVEIEVPDYPPNP